MDSRPESDVVVLAWTDPVVRAALADPAPASVPPHPAGDIDLPELPAEPASSAEEGHPTGA